MVSSDPGDKLLIERAQRDPRRFAELYEAHVDRVYAFIARRVSRRPDAQDLTAEVFHQALANLGRYEWRGVPFAAWLYRIAANAVADHHAREARARTVQHAKVRIAGSFLEMGEAHGQWQPMPGTFYLYVDDVDASYARALAAGATSVEAPAVQPYGERRAAVTDAFGHTWYLAAPVIGGQDPSP